MSEYLDRLRTQYEDNRKLIEGFQTRAAEEGRDLSEEELRNVETLADANEKKFADIERATSIETRNAKVASLGAELAPKAEKEETRSGRFTAKDRDPGHYRKNGSNSFFVDMYRAKSEGNEQSLRRLQEHARALDTGGEGVGTVAPHWLTEEFETIARQGRNLADAVRNIPLGSDPRPLTLPKQTAGTDAVVLQQTNENDAVSGTDAWDSDVSVVTPKATAGKQIVSRQMLDMSNPAVDSLIYGDLISAYNLKIEQKVGAALVTSAGSAVTTFANEAAFVGTAPAMPAIDAVIDTAFAVRNARKAAPSLLVLTVNRWGKFKKLKDTTGRPVIPSGSGGPMNVFGVGSVLTDGQVEDLGIIATDGLGNGSTYPESSLVIVPSDVLLFESDLLRFRFDEQVGPESVVLGIWGYSAVHVKYAGASVKRFVVTAAT
jgi:hypothetical protein